MERTVVSKFPSKLLDEKKIVAKTEGSRGLIPALQLLHSKCYKHNMFATNTYVEHKLHITCDRYEVPRGWCEVTVGMNNCSLPQQSQSTIPRNATFGAHQLQSLPD